MSAYGSGDATHEVLASALFNTVDGVLRARSMALAAPSCAAAAPGVGPATLADRQVELVVMLADQLARRLATHAFATRWAGAAYSDAEAFVHAQIDSLSDVVGSFMGTMLRPLVLGALLGGAGLTGWAAALGWAFDQVLANPIAGPILQQVINPVQALLDSAWQTLQSAFGPYLGQMLMAAVEDPTLVDIGGWIASGVDNFVLSTLGGVPYGGEDMDGIKTILALLLPIATGGTRLGMNRITPRQTEATSHHASADAPEPVAGYADGFDQIVSQADDIVINAYEMPDGSIRYQVFVQGTQNWSMGDGESAFDLQSNLENAASADQLYGTAFGLEQAMLDAGIQPGDDVDLFGYSQGGMATTLVAANGTFNVNSLTTYGAPTGWVDTPDDLNWTQIQLAQDIVPNIAGGQQLSNGGTLIEIDSLVEADSPIGYHLSDAYEPALEWLEASGDTAALAQMRQRANELIGATAVSTASYELDRE